MSNIFVLFFIQIAMSEADPKLISRLKKMSYEELVADDVSKVPFHEQVLVTCENIWFSDSLSPDQLISHTVYF